MSEEKSKIDWQKLFNASRTHVLQQWFNAQKVSLDGYHFENCRFDNCQLASNTGDFQLTNCFIAETNSMIFSKKLAKPIKLLVYKNRKLGVNPDSLSLLNVVENTDGTISIP